MIRRWRRWTLRTRLLLIGLLGLALAQAVGSIGLYAALSVESLRRVDRSAAATADEVAGLITGDRLPQTLPVTGVEVVQVLDPAGRVLSASVSSDRLTSMLRPGEVDRARHGPITVSGSRIGVTSRLRVRATDVDVGGTRRTVVVAEPIDDLLGSGRELRAVLLISYPLILLVLGLIAWRVIGAALRPVEELRSAAERISGSEEEDRLPVPASGDEIHALALTLNSMLDRLDRARAREAGLVADAAHELRSPLASMRMQIDVARRLGEGGTTLDELDVDVSRMAALVDDLLVLARIESGVDPDAGSDPGVTTGVRDALDRAAAQWSGPDLRVEVEPTDETVGVRDEELARIVTNLVGNAARHASTIRISTTRRSDRVLVLVDDDGPGVPEADRERVFERFTRLDDARDRDSGGAGLGLPIVRALAEARGGSVRLDRSPAGGLRVVVELPAAGTVSSS
jgi:signal transduction histidine kinase